MSACCVINLLCGSDEARGVDIPRGALGGERTGTDPSM